jgi:hypothetical protein
VLEQVAVTEPLCKMRNRAADVGGQQIQQGRHRRREPPDAKAAVEKQRRDIAAVEQVVQIVRALF